ncbi:MFS transporter [Paenibacillus amylolyticus]|nr:MFS transporter [Paenibacillus amylolyticus]
MTAALVISSVIALLSAFSPGYTELLLLRILQGVALAGLPAIAMTYLSEEIEPRSLGYAMGLYISGNSIGGMAGRFISGVVTDWFSWRCCGFHWYSWTVCSRCFLACHPAIPSFCQSCTRIQKSNTSFVVTMSQSKAVMPVWTQVSPDGGIRDPVQLYRF